jgi:hypothetical protein
MALQLKFANKKIPGTILSVSANSFDSHARRVHFPGVSGEVEIKAGSAGRDIVILMILHDQFKTFSRIDDQLDTLIHLAAGKKHGTIAITGERPRKFVRCTLDSMQELTLGGQQSPGALLDHAGTLDGGWFTTIQLRWRQLSME